VLASPIPLPAPVITAIRSCSRCMYPPLTRWR
jgi:hypothetical protein